jgi:hypothetical protein
LIVTHSATDTFLTELPHDPALGGRFGKAVLPYQCHGASLVGTGYFYCLFFALMTCASIAANAAPLVKSDTVTAPMMLQAALSVESVKVDLNGTGATILQRELSGVGEAYVVCRSRLTLTCAIQKPLC